MRVYGNGSVERRGKSSFRLRVVIGYKGDGSPKFKYKTVKASCQTEAERMLRLWIEELQALLEGNEPADYTCGEWFDKYLEACKADELALTTIDHHTQLLEGRLKPAFGDVKLKDLTPMMLTEFYYDAKTHGRWDGGPLSIGTIKKMSSFINPALELAVSQGVLQSNPNAKAKKFTGGRRGARRRSEEVAFSLEEMKALIARTAICPNRPLATAVMIAAHTGMRRSEVLGLRWGDVLWEKDVINVERGLNAITKGISPDGETLVIGPTKSINSDRLVPLVPVLREVLLEEWERQMREWAWRGQELTDEASIIQNKHGGPMRPNTLTTEFKEFAMGVEGINPEASFKSLRSGMASLLVEEGVHMMVIAWLLGDDASTVKQYYVKNVNDPQWTKLRNIIADATAFVA